MCGSGCRRVIWAWFVIDAVESLESRFAARVTPRGSAAGRAAFDPRVLLGVLVYGYATGVRSSRRIERACTEDVAFRVICAQDGPDHATVARFRREHFADPGAMGNLFTQVLVLAARAGLGKLGLIALDGTKIAATRPGTPAAVSGGCGSWRGRSWRTRRRWTRLKMSCGATLG